MADVLAWEASANEVCVSWSSGERSDVSMARDIWPVGSKDLLAVRLALAEGNGTHPSSLKSEAESADARKEVEDTHHLRSNQW
jgi:hypothetical protein